MGGGEAEDLDHLFARICVLSKIRELGSLGPVAAGGLKGKWVPVDHPKSKKHEGLAVYLALLGYEKKKTRIPVFEHFTHQLVIVLIDELVAVCIRS